MSNDSSSSEIRTSADQLGEGTVLKGTYRVLRFLGEGGAGSVYLGEHTSLGHGVAIKTLFGKFVRDPDMRRRFIEEGVIQANLSHKNIARVFDIVDEERMCAIIMEYIPGRSLDRWLEQQRAVGPIDITLQCKLFLEILDGVKYAHAHGVIHRDLKPANVLLAIQGDVLTPKVTDFGIAKVLSDYKHTATGTVMGTVHYASPEQLTDARSVDPRSDVYSLGCTLFEMVTGKLPFERDNMFGIMRAHLDAPRPDASELNPSVSRQLSLVIRKAMAIDREHRFAGCSEFAAELIDALGISNFELLAPAIAANPSARPASGRPSAAMPAAEPLHTARPGTAAPASRTTRGGGSPPATTSGRRTSVGAAPTTPEPRAAEAPPPVGRAVQAAIVVLALLLLAVSAIAAMRSREGQTDDDQTADVALAAVASPDVDTPPPSAADAGGADAVAIVTPPPEVANGLDARQCRELAGRYVDYNLAGDVPISVAISELESAQSGCVRALHALPDATAFDTLQGNLTGDQLRIVLSTLRAMRARATGEDPCNDAIIGATEAARSLRRVADAGRNVLRDGDPGSAGSLYEWEFRSLEPRRQFAWAVHRNLRTEYPGCMIDALPEELRDPAEVSMQADAAEGSGPKDPVLEPIDPVYVPITPD